MVVLDTQINNSFILKHSSGQPELDKKVRLRKVDGELKWDWDGLPQAYQFIMSNFSERDQTKNTLNCLQLVLNQIRDGKEMRPQTEIEGFLTAGIEDIFKRENPKDYYKTSKILYNTEDVSIYKCERRADQKQCVLKLMKEAASQDEKDNLYRESCMLRAFNDCPYILNIVEIFEFSKRLYTFLEFMEGGSINSIVEKRYQDYSEEFVKYTIFCVASGIKAIHDKNVLHRDIKSDNVLCDPNGDVKLSDLGTSVTLSADRNWRQTRCTTLNWLSPEQVKGQSYSKPVDLWAFGCFIYELGNGGVPPFKQKGNNKDSLFDAIEKNPVENIRIRSDEYNDLMQNCLKKKIAERFTIEQVLAHPYLEGAEGMKEQWKADYQAFLESEQEDINPW